ncbi:helix-turn-helix domain-containing protein [Riemerella anatipestifer]|uniref:terminase gpP N-terminus-related DNA-binding protein n=1 Tax=Riemerella anatipestifer TaxID=34085 RepID=UPI00129EF508|nr:helix-turn-helix domain-containing protein [Riemerella anatipestifer]MRM84520.1 hypothetical protein [Riemerella anatipestifer]WPC10748.1 helix-turn-helix domain-containing protein [Riemerella anatipestifer]WPC13602.1 helix-turn-helix domain-containing protein [Riemerella anatipestifer]WPC14621.1 helix-turn-helix domain-containing protein [Riemerella anatipestifer]
MAKETEQKIAKELYINQNKTPEEIAQKTGVNIRTVQRWIKEGNWKRQRDAKANSSPQRIERTQLVVDSLTDRRIQLIKDEKIYRDELQELDELGDYKELRERKQSLITTLTAIRTEAASIDDAISKWNKRIENLHKEGKITLSIYIEVMERIFEALRISNEPIYMQTLDFQENHLEEVSAKLP